jgi:hypothetical protein
MLEFSCANGLGVDISKLFDFQGHFHPNCKALFSSNYVKRLFMLEQVGQGSNWLRVHFQTVLDFLVQTENAIYQLCSYLETFLLFLMIQKPQGNQVKDNDLSSEGFCRGHADFSAGILIHTKVTKRCQKRSISVANPNFCNFYVFYCFYQVDNVCCLARLAHENNGIFLGRKIFRLKFWCLNGSDTVEYSELPEKVLSIDTCVIWAATAY